LTTTTLRTTLFWHFGSWYVEALNQPKTKSPFSPGHFSPDPGSYHFKTERKKKELPSSKQFSPVLRTVGGFAISFYRPHSLSFLKAKARASRHGASQTPGPGNKRGNSISGIINPGHLYSVLVCSR
jgi:hypothetical protein